MLIFHNFQGLKFFEFDVAEYLAKLGYVGLAADLYGDLVPPDQRLWPEDEQLVPAFRKRCFEGLVSLDHDHEKFRAFAEDLVGKSLESPLLTKRLPQLQIGYCFGGMAVLEVSEGGLDVSELFLSMACCKPERIRMPQNMEQRYHR